MKKEIMSQRKLNTGDASFMKGIRHLIIEARSAVVKNVDFVQVYTSFEIGRRIVEYEQNGSQRAEYGTRLLSDLAAFLTKEFGRGFSRSNLEYMRKFFLTYRHRSEVSMISQMSSGKSVQPKFSLSWSQYVFLVGVKDCKVRDFYEIEAQKNNWTLPELTRQFNSCLYERLALSRDTEGVQKLSKEGQLVVKPQDLLKEPLVLEFLGLDESEKYSESDLESAIIDKLEDFLLELGKGFLFEARQKRFTLDEEHFFRRT